MKAIRSDDYAIKICEALGIESNRVRRVVIDAKAGETLKVYVELVGVSQTVDIPLPIPDGDLDIVTVGTPRE